MQCVVFRPSRSSIFVRRSPAVCLLMAALAGGLAQGQPASVNFVLHGVSGDRAAVVLDAAERIRGEVISVLLAEDPVPAWQARCAIHLHATAESFAAAVGGPPDGVSGATTIDFAGDVVALRRIDLMDDTADGIPGALAHELVHVLLADRFTQAPPPRWADEGLAVLFDDRDMQAAHERGFLDARSSGGVWSAAHLLAMDDYPREPHRQRVFYGQSAALVRWLVARRDHPTLLRFLDDAASDGASAALEKHYGFASADDLERAWLASPSATDIGGD